MDWIIFIVIVVIVIALIAAFFDYVLPLFFSMLYYMSMNAGLMFLILVAFLMIRYLATRNKKETDTALEIEALEEQ